jgi:hypothetical protein
MSANLAIFGTCLVILGAFFLMLAITVKSPRTIMREILGVRVDRLKTFRYFITQRLEATLGFLFILLGSLLQLSATLRASETPHLAVWVVLTLVTMAVVGVLTYRFCHVLAKWIFIRLFRTYAERYRIPIHRDESLLKELGDILEIPRDEDETIETFAEKIRKRLGLDYQPRPRA